MSDPRLNALRDLVQEDRAGRGLRRDPAANLVTACPDDLADACGGIAAHPRPRLLVFTGFFIPTARPPAAETDGPPGALFLARALAPLGVGVTLAAEDWCVPALRAGLELCGLAGSVEVLALPLPALPGSRDAVLAAAGPVTHLVALERVGPSHTAGSLARQPGSLPADVAEYQSLVRPHDRGRCYTMRGRDVTEYASTVVADLFESPPPGVVTVGVGDGGNEVGMGKVPWSVVRRNVPNGERIACRVPAAHLVVCGVSNWGAWALGAGVRVLRGAPHDPGLFDPAREEALLRHVVGRGPLVDGVVGLPVASVDGLPFGEHARILEQVGKISQSQARG